MKQSCPSRPHAPVHQQDPAKLYQHNVVNAIHLPNFFFTHTCLYNLTRRGLSASASWREPAGGCKRSKSRTCQQCLYKSSCLHEQAGAELRQAGTKRTRTISLQRCLKCKGLPPLPACMQPSARAWRPTNVPSACITHSGF